MKARIAGPAAVLLVVSLAAGCVFGPTESAVPSPRRARASARSRRRWPRARAPSRRRSRRRPSRCRIRARPTHGRSRSRSSPRSARRAASSWSPSRTRPTSGSTRSSCAGRPTSTRSLFLAPFEPSDDRIREGGPPLVQEWTKWVVGPGERGEPEGTTSLGYGPILAGHDPGDPDHRRAPRSRAGRVRPPGPVRQRPAAAGRWQRCRRAAGGDSLMPAILPAWTEADPELHARLAAAIDPDRKVLQALERIVPLSGKRIADVGTGIGHYPMLLARRTGRTYGVESDPALLAEARRLVAETHQPNIRIVEGDAAQPPAARRRGGLRALRGDRTRRHVAAGDRRGDAGPEAGRPADRHRLLRPGRRRSAARSRDGRAGHGGHAPTHRLVAAQRLQDQGRPQPRGPQRHRAGPRAAAAPLWRPGPRLPDGAARTVPPTEPRPLPSRGAGGAEFAGSVEIVNSCCAISAQILLAARNRARILSTRSRARLFSPRSLAFGMSASERRCGRCDNGAHDPLRVPRPHRQEAPDRWPPRPA